MEPEHDEAEFFEIPQIPDDEMVIAQVLITLVVNPDGTQGLYKIIRGELSASSFIGLVELAKLQLFDDQKNW